MVHPRGRAGTGRDSAERRCREAREETCLTVEPTDLLGIYDRVLHDDAGRTLYHFVLVDFLCRPVAGTGAGGRRCR